MGSGSFSNIPINFPFLPDPFFQSGLEGLCNLMKDATWGTKLVLVFLGLLLGAVAGSALDKILAISIFNKSLLAQPLSFEFYIIQVGIQLTPASLIGLVVVLFLVLKKG